jgi:hypothetical protein
MPDLDKGFAFAADGDAATVTAARLNALVDAAVIRPEFYDRPPRTSAPEDSDLLLVRRPGIGFRSVEKRHLFPPAAQPGVFRGLSVQSSSEHPTTLEVDVRELVLRSPQGSALYFAAISAEADAALYSSGPVPGGRDFATLSANSWLYLWAISDGADVALLFSDSSTAPRMPAGYTHRTLLSAWRFLTNAFRPGRQNERLLLWRADSTTAPPELFSVGGSTALPFFPMAFSGAALWPPGITARVHGCLTYAGTAVNGWVNVQLGASSTGHGAVPIALARNAQNQRWLNETVRGAVQFTVPVLPLDEAIYLSANEADSNVNGAPITLGNGNTIKGRIHAVELAI